MLPVQKIHILPFIFLLFSAWVCRAADSTTVQPTFTKPDFFQVGVHRSMIFAHGAGMAHLAKSHPWAVEVTAQWNPNNIDLGRKWAPTKGYTLTYYNFDNPDVLGSAWAGEFFLQFNKPAKGSNKRYFFFRAGTGAAYVTHGFDRETNNQNNVLSSRINGVMHFQAGYLFFFSKAFRNPDTPATQWGLHLSLDWTHYSNGSFKVPNLGINMPSFHIAFIPPFRPKHGYSPNRILPYNGSKEILVARPTTLHIAWINGVKEIYPTGGPKYWGTALSMYISKQVTRVTDLNIGFDAYYDESLKALRERDKVNKNDPNFHPHIFRAAVIFGFECHFGRTSFLGQFGVNVYRPYDINPRLYERIGLKYRVWKGLHAGVSLKAFLGAADFFEYTLTYALPLVKKHE